MIEYYDTLETDLIIDLPDGKKIHGLVRGSLTDGSPVAIMLHGRPGWGNEVLQFLGARYLHEQRVTTIRLWMYDYGEEYRDLLDCTLDTHISDFDVVVGYLRKQNVARLFAIGHSYGGITILGSNSKLDGAVLWEPTHGMAWQDPVFNDPKFPEKQVGDFVIGTGGHAYVTSKNQMDYDQHLGDTTSWASNKDYPIKFIAAGAGPLAKYVEQYYDNADVPKSFVIIDGAHHQLEDNDKVIDQLFSETSKWILNYSQRE